MMELTKLIKEGIKKKKVIIGYNRVVKSMKMNRPKLIVLAKNTPEDKAKIIKHNAKIAKVDIKQYQKDNINLGLVCGKPFPVSILAIKE